jgi:hypothetical protein
MIEELRYRLDGWRWRSRALVSQLRAQLSTRWTKWEERGRRETIRWYRLSQKQRHVARVRRWASILAFEETRVRRTATRRS